jgi:hypothetical protein
MTSGYKTYRVSADSRAPLVGFLADSLRQSGCVILNQSSPHEAPFRISFLAPWGERMGVVAYAFLATSKQTRNRPADEHRFQMKYGSKDGRLHELWQDPFGLYTTICVGINLEEGFFVGVDPVLNSPTLFFISKEFKQENVDEIKASGWHAWERYVRPGARRRSLDDDPAVASDLSAFEDGHEVLVGATAGGLLRYILFEREVVGEDQGHRQLVAERFPSDALATGIVEPTNTPSHLISPARLHALEGEFELPADQILQLIANAPRLKMAVRGWVAERHLQGLLERIPIVTEVTAIEEDGRPDFQVRVQRSDQPLLIECKNVLRTTTSQGFSRLDFMKTRASPADPCSRYYCPSDFHVIAACLHARSERWEFAVRQTSEMAPHVKCPGKLNHRVVVDDAWTADLAEVLETAALGR